MKLHQIRNATIVLEYNGIRFLIDPMFAPKEAYQPITLKLWPYHDLPISPKDIVKNIDAVILTHLHTDHFDKYAQEILAKSTKIFVQDKYDKNALGKEGFNDIEIINKDGTKFEGIKLYNIECRQGIRALTEPVMLANGMRWEAMGVVFKSENEPALYIAGDTVWYDGIKDAIKAHKPKYIVLNTACTKTSQGFQTNMGTEDIKELHNYYPEGKLIASHMDNVGNETLCRVNLRDSEVKDYIYIPADGEIIMLD